MRLHGSVSFKHRGPVAKVIAGVTADSRAGVDPRSYPTVDVLVSTWNEERYVSRCLDAVLEQDYPPDRLHVWLIDGGSSDTTVELARGVALQDSRLTVIADGLRRNLPAALNVVLELSSSEFVAKVDAHGYPARDFVRRAVEAFASASETVACVGGRPEQEGESEMGKAVAAARTSRFGVGASGYAGSSTIEYVDTVQCGVYRRAALDRVGWFDPEMAYGEDEELNWRLRTGGYHILLDTRIRFHYVTRATWTGAFRQYRNYGGARIRVIFRHPAFARPHHFAPAVFVAGLVVLTAASPFTPAARRVAAAFWALYAGVALLAARRAARGQRASTGRTTSAFLALHLGYGTGSLLELGARLRRRFRLRSSRR